MWGDNLPAETETQSQLHPHNIHRYVLVFIIDFLPPDMIHVFPFTCHTLCSQTQYRSNKRRSRIHSSPWANTNVLAPSLSEQQSRVAALGFRFAFVCIRKEEREREKGMVLQWRWCFCGGECRKRNWLTPFSLANKDEWLKFPNQTKLNCRVQPFSGLLIASLSSVADKWN